MAFEGVLARRAGIVLPFKRGVQETHPPLPQRQIPETRSHTETENNQAIAAFLDRKLDQKIVKRPDDRLEVAARHLRKYSATEDDITHMSQKTGVAVEDLRRLGITASGIFVLREEGTQQFLSVPAYKVPDSYMPATNKRIVTVIPRARQRSMRVVA